MRKLAYQIVKKMSYFTFTFARDRKRYITKYYVITFMPCIRHIQFKQNDLN